LYPVAVPLALLAVIVVGGGYYTVLHGAGPAPEVVCCTHAEQLGDILGLDPDARSALILDAPSFTRFFTCARSKLCCLLPNIFVCPPRALALHPRCAAFRLGCMGVLRSVRCVRKSVLRSVPCGIMAVLCRVPC
jgi:hypothetical protein